MNQGAYPYLSAEGVPVAQPLFQEEGDGSTPISALQLYFEETDVTTACQLVALWHSRLPKMEPSTAQMAPYVFYVAVHANRIYAVAMWSQPVARLLNGRGWIELRRMAVSPQAPKNTASRMLGWMTKDIKKRFPDVVRLVSYQDCEVHTGTIYKASGWTATTINKDGDWNRPNRYRKAAQSFAAKQRWELQLRETA